MQTEIIAKLTNEYTKTKSRNPSYSLRAFSSRIGIPVSALSEILNGKRELTNKMAKRILDGLGVNPLESQRIIDGFENQDSDENNLNLQQFKVISEWYCFAILSLAEINDFSIDPDWISKRLNIQKREAKSATNTLIDLGMLEQDVDGKYVATGVQYKTPSDIANISLKNHTLQTMELAKESLLHDPVEIRDFSTVTMAIDPSKINEAKKMIKTFRKRISKKLESGNKKEVYKIAIQLFPLTKEIRENNHENH